MTYPRCWVCSLQSLLFSSAGRKGFGLQTTWGHGFLMSHLKSASGLRCWSGPCYVYITGGNHVGLGKILPCSLQ